MPDSEDHISLGLACEMAEGDEEVGPSLRPRLTHGEAAAQELGASLGDLESEVSWPMKAPYFYRDQE